MQMNVPRLGSDEGLPEASPYGGLPIARFHNPKAQEEPGSEIDWI